MRDRSSLVLLMVVLALLAGIAAGWWLRGGDSASLLAPTDGSSAIRTPRAESVQEDDSLRAADRGQSIAARRLGRDRESRDVVVDGSASEPPIDANPKIDEMNDEQRARYRIEDFQVFGDGPVGRDPSADLTRRARDAQSDCRPLGASGCRRDLDCCGAGVCRTKAGQIAGFLECTDPR